MIKYYAWVTAERIERREVTKETACYVTAIVNGRTTRDAKRLDHCGYFDTWQEAHAFLISHREHQIDVLERSLAQERAKLKKLMEMTE
jgi:ribosomal protein S16